MNSYYTSATNHTAQVNQKKQARLKLTEEELHDPFNQWNQIIFTDHDDRFQAAYASCGVFQPFLKLIGFGCDEFLISIYQRRGMGEMKP